MPANDQDTTAPSSTSQPAKGSALANVSALRPALHPSEGGSSYFQPTVSSSLSKEISPNSPSSPHADASQPVSPGTQIPQSPRTGFRQGSIQLGSPDIRRMSLNVPGSPMPRDGRGRLLARSLKRGMTFDQVQIQGILDEEEKGGQFDDLPLDDKEIKKLPKKVSLSSPGCESVIFDLISFAGSTVLRAPRYTERSLPGSRCPPLWRAPRNDCQLFPETPRQILHPSADRSRW